ncbi:Unconventional myosin-VI [Armadillidium nasatum]|uniref:Unconventional myosin-VI n=1 Tax=Armadillidium nasatum TaxID=96803 RepID=A0A5N5SJL0_9CRUS|nr:Unconventional myosin-VI [Armadillidium nasatum]
MHKDNQCLGSCYSDEPIVTTRKFWIIYIQGLFPLMERQIFLLVVSKIQTELKKGMEGSQLVWIADQAHGFILGNITDIGSDGVTVVPLQKGLKTVHCDYDRVFPAEEDTNKDVDDNCKIPIIQRCQSQHALMFFSALMYLNEATLLNNIKTRYLRDKIYVSYELTTFFLLLFLFITNTGNSFGLLLNTSISFEFWGDNDLEASKESSCSNKGHTWLIF